MALSNAGTLAGGQVPGRTRSPLVFVTPFMPGMAHALSSVVVGSPFDTVKTRLQVGMHTSALQCVRSTVTQEGPLALYRGALMPLASLAIKRPLEFAAFEWCNKRFGARTKGPILGGFIAGVISAFLGCPFSVIKVQMQAHREDVYRHTFQAVRQVWATKGPLGFYRGIGASLIMSVPSTTFYLGAYGMLRERLPPSRWSTAFAGMAASLSMWSCLLPLDNVRTVTQAKTFSKDQHIPPWSELFRDIVRRKGVLGLWAGWSAVVVRAPLMSAVSMLAYEQARVFADAIQKDAASPEAAG